MERLLTTEEVAERYGVTVNTVKYWRARTTGPKWFRAGKHPRYRESDLAKWEAEQVERRDRSA